MSLGTGRPIILRDENSIRHCRLLLSHRMTSPTDVRLIALIELVARKSMGLIQEKKACSRATDSIAQIYETLVPMKGQVNHDTVAFIRRANLALEKWWADCDDLHRKHTLSISLLLT
jgi:hypothetical protein